MNSRTKVFNAIKLVGKALELGDPKGDTDWEATADYMIDCWSEELIDYDLMVASEEDLPAFLRDELKLYAWEIDLFK